MNLVLRSKSNFAMSDEAVDDIKQECWIDALKALKKWEPERGSLKNFLFTCFYNKGLKYTHYFGPKYNVINVDDVCETEIGEAKDLRDYPELDVQVNSRLRGFVPEYILQRVCIALYLGIFERKRKTLISEIRKLSRLRVSRIVFLVDYSLVIIRRYYVENGWKIDSLA